MRAGSGGAASTSGGINDRAEYWVRNICRSKWSKDWVRNGFPLWWEDKAVQPPAQQHRNHSGATQHADVLTKMLGELTAAGAAREVQARPKVVLPLNVIPKRQEGKFRLLLDGRKVNEFLYCPRFKFERLTELEHLLQPGEFMMGVDLKDGYWQLRMSEEAQQYLGFEWQGRYYVFTVLPFGITSAPWGFQKLMREFSARLRSRGFRLVNYLDDFLFLLGTDKAEALRARDELLAEFRAAGLEINAAKSQLEPTTRLQCLGFTIDSATMRFEVPEARWAGFQAALTAVRQSGGTCGARTLARAVGHAVSLHLVAGRFVRLFTRACTAALAAAPSWDADVPLGPEVRAEVDFWAGLRREALTAQVCAESAVVGVDVTLNTDASSFAWAGVASAELRAKGYLKPWERELSSGLREVLAIERALLALQQHLRGKRVLVRTDSTNARSAVEHGSGRPLIHAAALRIFWWAQEQGVRLTVAWVPREQNAEADALSKLEESCDWQLHPKWFGLLDVRWGKHTVDRFASAENRQGGLRFNSLYYSPGAEAVDCFTQDWNGEGEVNWCNPPFALVGRLWAFLRAKSVRAATVIVPDWPSAPWWPALCSVAGWSPAVLEVQELDRAVDLFRPGVHNGNQHGVGKPRWRVFALRVSFARGWEARVRQPYRSKP